MPFFEQDVIRWFQGANFLGVLEDSLRKWRSPKRHAAGNPFYRALRTLLDQRY
jgi:hypothetical protein